MRILFMGPQGSGKGLISGMISEKLGIPTISSGGLLRDVPKDHPSYETIHDQMNKGILVDQHLVADLIRGRVSQEDCAEGYILDGWFRNMLDVEKFDVDPEVVIVLDISRETSVKRITGRRTCTSDGKTYNIYTLPKEELENCKGELVARDDDTEEAVNARLDIYYSETVEVINYLKERGVPVYEIDAERTPQEICDDVMKVL